jgi:hypothetical protein
VDGPGSDSTARLEKRLASKGSDPFWNWLFIKIANNATKEESNMQPTHLTSKQDEAEIHRLIAEWSAALEAKDLDGLTAGYLPDSIP